MKIIESIKKKVLNFALKEAKRKTPIISDILDNPENLKFEGFINSGDKITITITRKDGG